MNTTKQKVTLLLEKNSVEKLKSIKKESGACLGFQVQRALEETGVISKNK